MKIIITERQKKMLESHNDSFYIKASNAVTSHLKSLYPFVCEVKIEKKHEMDSNYVEFTGTFVMTSTKKLNQSESQIIRKLDYETISFLKNIFNLTTINKFFGGFKKVNDCDESYLYF